MHGKSRVKYKQHVSAEQYHCSDQYPINQQCPPIGVANELLHLPHAYLSQNESADKKHAQRPQHQWVKAPQQEGEYLAVAVRFDYWQEWKEDVSHVSYSAEPDTACREVQPIQDDRADGRLG